MSEQKVHFSERLGRHFQDGDELTPAEVAQVVAENSGHEVKAKRVWDLAEQYNLTRHYPYPLSRLVLYQYSEIKSLVVSDKRGRRPNALPSPVALRQRAYKARRAARVQDRGQGDNRLKRELTD